MKEDENRSRRKRRKKTMNDGKENKGKENGSKGDGRIGIRRRRGTGRKQEKKGRRIGVRDKAGLKG